MDKPSFKEDHISQIPSLQLLQNLGYTYLTPDEANKLRNEKLKGVVLEGILHKKLHDINMIKYRGEIIKFSPKNIYHAVRELVDVSYEGLVQTNEAVYDLLNLGKSFEETIHGNTRSYTMHYVDWENWENNAFHVTEEFVVERTGSHETRSPDLVLFVNGIPFSVIECKRPVLTDSAEKDPIEQAISQQLRNQHLKQIPHLFFYAQILAALSTNDASYGTVGSPKRFWSKWREQKLDEKRLHHLVNSPLNNEQKEKLFSDRFQYVKTYFNALEQEPRQITKQDELIYNLFRPERLLELANRFILFEAGDKKIARYQQYFSVKSILERVRIFKEDGQRKGGVIWHTQGSGKSLTMVMMAKAIALEPSIKSPKIVVVTDRVELDDQIARTFKHCGKDVVQARTGKHLMGLIEGQKETIVTTIINKFMASIKRREFRNNDPNVFVLVDEAHRSQYKEMHAVMRKVLPMACYLGFTGTPISKKSRNTYVQFGGIIEPSYTIDAAIKDKAVVPLLYEGRYVPQYVEQDQIDNWFNRVSEPLSVKESADLKRKFSTADQINRSHQRVHMIAWDISKHFEQAFQGTPYKGQLTAPNKLTAIKYKEYFDEIGIVSTEVLISPPDTREGHEEAYGDSTDEVQRFWAKMMEQYYTPDEYDRRLRDKFKKSDDLEIIIVVEKLLTGFDAPRNTVLYIDRKLTEHSLLQAIARVNRLYDGKDYGYIIDYYGILENLDKALTDYRALEAFNEEDLTGTLTNIQKEVDTLAQKHSELHDIFKSVENKLDEESYEKLLADEVLRVKFYDKLKAYARTLQVALSSIKFHSDTPEVKIQGYKDDLKYFNNLRSSVRRRYAEVVDFKEYELRVKKLIDTYVSSDEVKTITDLIPIFDQEKFDAEVVEIIGEDAKADTIAYRTLKTINEKMDEDPYFYKKFSKILQDVIEDYRKARISGAQYLQKASDIMNKVRTRHDDDTPDALKHEEIPRAFYGVTKDIFSRYLIDQQSDVSVRSALEIDEIIRNNKMIDWTHNKDVQNQIKNKIEDYLYDLSDEQGMDLSFDEIDLVLDKVMEIALLRYAD